MRGCVDVRQMEQEFGSGMDSRCCHFVLLEMAPLSLS